ncbi:MAG: hypothetical protein KDC45_05455 [Bacteroidetes bacterium]|nr:hypothetical protein [Bacteroidota bacterium]
MIRTFLFAVLLICAACSNHDNEVIVIEKTGTYHTEDCAKVKMAKTESMPIGEAKQKNMKPCGQCQPDAKEKK